MRRDRSSREAAPCDDHRVDEFDRDVLRRRWQRAPRPNARGDGHRAGNRCAIPFARTGEPLGFAAEQPLPTSVPREEPLATNV